MSILNTVQHFCDTSEAVETQDLNTGDLEMISIDEDFSESEVTKKIPFAMESAAAKYIIEITESAGPVFDEVRAATLRVLETLGGDE